MMQIINVTQLVTKW